MSPKATQTEQARPYTAEEWAATKKQIAELIATSMVQQAQMRAIFATMQATLRAAHLDEVADQAAEDWPRENGVSLTERIAMDHADVQAYPAEAQTA